MRVVIDSGSLMVLAKLNILMILIELFDEILIPDSVYYESVIEGIKLGKMDAVILNNFIDRNNKKIILIKTDKQEQIKTDIELDDGEKSVLKVAIKYKPDLVIIDELKGREVFRNKNKRGYLDKQYIN
jgi:predicted nucleic acid-binding protein